MKKLLFVLTGLMLVAVINAQSLEDIVKKYTEANKLDKIGAISTIKITAKISVMGMDLPMELWMKNPNKMKSVTSFNGQDMITVFDGEKGYSINPMTGSADAVELTPDQAKQAKERIIFQNYMEGYLKDSKLKLLGEENVNEKPAFKLQADLGNGNTTDLFIDKASYLLVKTSSIINADGQTVTAETYPSDYKETNGVLLPMKTTTSAQGMEMVMIYDKVEVNLPMEDSIFKIK